MIAGEEKIMKCDFVSAITLGGTPPAISDTKPVEHPHTWPSLECVRSHSTIGRLAWTEIAAINFVFFHILYFRGMPMVVSRSNGSLSCISFRSYWYSQLEPHRPLWPQRGSTLYICWNGFRVFNGRRYDVCFPYFSQPNLNASQTRGHYYSGFYRVENGIQSNPNYSELLFLTQWQQS